MAKELPYFQFEPAEYLTKDISFCSLAAQGMFINICAYFWQRGCSLTKQQVLRRLNHEDYFNELVEEGVIYLDGENITISFLKEQYENIEIKKTDSSIKGKIGNLKRWNLEIYKDFKVGKISLNDALIIAKSSGGDKLATAEKSEIREEKIREDKKREDEGVNNIIVNAIRVFDSDGIYATCELAKNYVLDTSITSAVIKNKENGFKDLDHLKEMMLVFESELKQNGETVKQFKDFNSHFRRWHKVKIKYAKEKNNKEIKKVGTRYIGII
jgi:hypothetical protein